MHSSRFLKAAIEKKKDFITLYHSASSPMSYTVLTDILNITYKNSVADPPIMTDTHPYVALTILKFNLSSSNAVNPWYWKEGKLKAMSQTNP